MANCDGSSKKQACDICLSFFLLFGTKSDFDWKMKSTTTSSKIEQMRGLKKEAHLGV
jgi:hypothetical protein